MEKVLKLYFATQNNGGDFFKTYAQRIFDRRRALAATISGKEYFCKWTPEMCSQHVYEANKKNSKKKYGKWSKIQPKTLAELDVYITGRRGRDVIICHLLLWVDIHQLLTDR